MTQQEIAENKAKIDKQIAYEEESLEVELRIYDRMIEMGEINLAQDFQKTIEGTKKRIELFKAIDPACQIMIDPTGYMDR